jgi:hypothetical protein
MLSWHLVAGGGDINLEVEMAVGRCCNVMQVDVEMVVGRYW